MKQIITEIQSWGIRVPSDIIGRNGGAGPAEGRAMLIEGVAVNVPICADYTALSPFHLVAEPANGYGLYRQDTRIATVSVVPRPRFYRQTDSDGVPYWKIALLHGNDCLATTVLQRCTHWKNDRRCAFCATERSLKSQTTIAVKTSAQLTEVARHAQSVDQVSHMVLTSGTADIRDREIDYMARCTAAIKASVQLPIHVQFLPPADLGKINQLKTAGVDTVGIHIESFDDDVLRLMAPAKARIGLDKYEAAWKEAVSVFGPNQVSSFLIAGLGESPDSITWGSEFLADLGVYPFIVPLRPIPGTPLQDAIPPEPGVMSHIYQSAANILRRKGLTSRDSLAGCVRCGACSALPLYEEPFHQLTYHSARTDDELSQAFKIRREVFVNEQALFVDSDIDEFDARSIHIVAKKEGRVIGTVRIFPDPQYRSGHWVGGRLAVLKEFRDYRVGAALVKEAMIRVKKKGGVVFTAHIQKNNIRFFRKLGWEALGPIENYLGRPHQIMQADLSRVKSETNQNFSQSCSTDFDTAAYSPALNGTPEHRSLF
jgi:radical SAM protein (TIGR04043 family)/putative N-acetyltransferase (TIGR04045 family)